jgi:hypothetical protein
MMGHARSRVHSSRLPLTSAMSLALKVPEILKIVLEDIYFNSDTPQHDTLALALTCKDFLEPALNTLWSYLPSILPLIKCFPTDAVKDPDEERFKD